MKRYLLSLVLVSFLAPASGCAICCAPFDYDYNAFGGRWDRVNRSHGRVGSAFEPAEAGGSGDMKLGNPPTDVAGVPQQADVHYE